MLSGDAGRLCWRSWCGFYSRLFYWLVWMPVIRSAILGVHAHCPIQQPVKKECLFSLPSSHPHHHSSRTQSSQDTHNRAGLFAAGVSVVFSYITFPSLFVLWRFYLLRLLYLNKPVQQETRYFAHIFCILRLLCPAL